MGQIQDAVSRVRDFFSSPDNIARLALYGILVLFFCFILFFPRGDPQADLKKERINRAAETSAIEAVNEADEEIARSSAVARKVENEIVRGSVPQAGDEGDGDAARVRRSYDSWRGGIERLRPEDGGDQGS